MAAETDDVAGKPSEPPERGQRAKASGSGPKTSATSRLVSFTIDTGTGQIVKLEAVEDSGARRELTAEEKTALVKQRAKSTLQDVLEQTFEAGMVSVLGEDYEDYDLAEEEFPETEEDAKLRHLIIGPMIEKSVAGRLLGRQVLGRAILGTLIQDIVAAEHRASPSRTGGPSTSSRTPSSRGRSQQQH
jgi:hypothetical protein